jgi:hypothetical protein
MFRPFDNCVIFGPRRSSKGELLSSKANYSWMATGIMHTTAVRDPSAWVALGTTRQGPPSRENADSLRFIPATDR